MNNRILKSFGFKILFSVFAVCISACEARLDLSGVEGERQKPVHRYDEFQQGAVTSKGAVLVGLGGVAVESTDGGVSWERQTFEVSEGYLPSFIDVAQCPDGRTVILDIGKRIWQRTDVGAEWVSIPVDSEEDVLALTCDPTGRIWVVGGFSLVISSGDGGKTWRDQSTGEDAMLTSISFLDVDNGYVAGEFGSVFRTEDGGKTWAATEPVPNELYIHDVYFSNAEKGRVAGLNGIVFRTDDAGVSWEREETGTPATLYRFAEHDNSLFVSGGFGTLLKNVGDKWEPVERSTTGPGYIRSLVSMADSYLVIGGAGFVDRFSLSPAVQAVADAKLE